MKNFGSLLVRERLAVERFVRFRINTKADAEDVLQEIYFAAFQKFSELKNKASFKAWLISIARNKCNDYFRRKAAMMEVPIDNLAEKILSVGRYDGRHGVSEIDTVRDTISLLGDKEKQILYLYFWKEMPQAEIADYLGIPVGTVKSRLHTAKQNFKSKYLCRTGILKGDASVKRLPERMPEYTIKESDEAPFAVKWEELMGRLEIILPSLTEKRLC